MGDAYNGHVPISAILACAGTVAAVLSGHHIVVSNETFRPMNRPWSTKEWPSITSTLNLWPFEKDFQAVLKQNFGDSIRYYSFLRPFLTSEVHIAQLFAKDSFQKYKAVFSSCNKAFTSTQ